MTGDMFKPMLSVLTVCVGAAVWAQADTTLEPARTGQMASVVTIQGDAVRLDDLAGEVVLLTFIRTQTDPTAQTSDPSRTQLVQLKSLARQYGSEGLRVFLVAADAPTSAVLETFMSDWGLQRFPLLLDEQGEAARAYRVSHLPTTLLIGTGGRASARWEGATRPAELAMVVRRTLGLP